MFEKELNRVKNVTCLRLDYDKELRDYNDSWNYFRIKYPLCLGSIERINFSLPKGWRSLCEGAFSFLEDLKDVKVIQVKQKLGRLCIYTARNFFEEVSTIVNVAEGLARTTCEFCGSTDKVSLFEGSYIARSCISCTTVFCEYTIMNWVLNGETNEMNKRQLFCVEKLRKIHNENISRTSDEHNTMER